MEVDLDILVSGVSREIGDVECEEGLGAGGDEGANGCVEVEFYVAVWEMRWRD